MPYVKVQVVGWYDPGEPPISPPGVGIPGFPDQGLPSLPPGFWGGGSGQPGQGLPPSYPGRPGQGLPWPGRPVDPGWGVGEEQPGQGLPTPPDRQPKAHDIGDAPDEPGEGGRWVVVVYGDTVAWAYLPADTPDE